MASNPQYVGTPKSPSATISTANANRDGTGTLVTLMTAGTSGSRVDRVNITATGTTTAGMVRFFVNSSLIREIPVLPLTPASAVPAWSADVVFDNGLVLEAGATLKVSTNNAETFRVTVINGGDF
jgi:hypothetical protein